MHSILNLKLTPGDYKYQGIMLSDKFSFSEKSKTLVMSKPIRPCLLLKSIISYYLIFTLYTNAYHLNLPRIIIVLGSKLPMTPLGRESALIVQLNVLLCIWTLNAVIVFPASKEAVY